MKKLGTTIVIEDNEDEQIIRLDVDDFTSSWDDVLIKWTAKYNLDIVDHRYDHDHEYTQVNAQRDPDFFDEAMTQEELDEIMERKAMYHNG